MNLNNQQLTETFYRQLQCVLALTEEILEKLEENSRLPGATHLPLIEPLFQTRESQIEALNKSAEQLNSEEISSLQTTLLQTIVSLNEKIAFSLQSQHQVLEMQLRKISTSRQLLGSYHSNIENVLPDTTWLAGEKKV